MKKLITKTLIKEVKRMLKQEYHDQEWHDFFARKDVIAIESAIENLGSHPISDESAIQEEALGWLKILDTYKI